MNRAVKITAGLLRCLAPEPVREKMNRLSVDREVRRAMQVAQSHRVTREEFVTALEHFDISGYDVIFLHTSISNIGKIQGGTKFLAGTILNFVDTTHRTLLVSALPHRGRFVDYLRATGTFDVRSAPIAMGTINEALAATDRAIRSIHPTHSVVAIGPEAHALTDGHPLGDTPFGKHSPYYKLIAARGAVLLVGATLNNLTFVHAIEDMLGDEFPVNPYLKRRFRVRCIDREGRETIVETPCHSPWKSAFRDVSLLEQEMAACGALRSVDLGAGKICLIDAHAFTMRYLDSIARGKSIYGHHFVTKRLQRKIDQVRAELLQGNA